MDTKLEAFIREYGDGAPDRLLLRRSRWPDIDMDLAVNTIAGRKRMSAKVPAWSGTEGLLYPTRLCTEQCSSEVTALYKASVAERLFRENAWGAAQWKEGAGAPSGAAVAAPASCGVSPGDSAATHLPRPRIADLTGGIGVDSWAFSRIASEILHNEADSLLSECAGKNLTELGVRNLRRTSLFIDESSISPLLGEFSPDIVFLDPARRSSTGGKLFLIEDCSPDVLKLREALFRHCRFILVKLSPMADISMACSRLGHVREVHCVGSDGECKELLIVMDRDYDGEHRLLVHDGGRSVEFSPSFEKRAGIRLLSPDEDMAGRVLFEPGKALAKAGMFNSLCARFGLVRLGRSTNLYLVPEEGTDIAPFGKSYLVEKVLPLDNRSMKECGKELGWADVSARNIPMSSETLMKKMDLRPGRKSGTGSVPHVFGATVEYAGGSPCRKLLVTLPRSTRHGN